MSRRILLLITDLQIGGTPTVVRELAIRLNRAGLHVEVACLSSGGPVSQQLNDAGVTTHALDARGPRDLPRTVGRLVRLVRDGGGLKPTLQASFDTVFSFLVHANVTAALASLRLRDVRFIQSVQTTQPEPAWHWKVQRFAARRTQTVVVPSPSVARVAGVRSHIPPAKFVVIPNAVDTQIFQPIIRSASSDTSRHRIGFLGRLDPVKQVDQLLRTMCELDPRYELHIFGDGAERENLQRLTLGLHLSSRVTFHGTVASPVDALRAIDLLVLPSQAEGFGLVLIEAMAAGVPVVGTDVDGIRDVIQHEHNGILARSASTEDLTRAIHALTGDDEASAVLRRRVVEGGLKTVQEKYTWDAVVGEYLKVLA